MFDVFSEEIEVQIKLGISTLYWYVNDLKKAWLRAGVDDKLCNSIFIRKNSSGLKPSKREFMDMLYVELRNTGYNKRLEVSRNFVRFLIEHKNFVPHDQKHRIEIAEKCSLKLKDILNQQLKEREKKEIIKKPSHETKKSYSEQISMLENQFKSLFTLEPQKRGYELEKLFTELMKISGVFVEKSFKIEAEQIDGAIKYEGHYYLVELKWTEKKIDQAQIASLYFKAEGKLDARGVFFSINGYSKEVLSTLPRGREIKVLLFDGVHLMNVFSGIYTFNELLEYSLKQASLKGEIYCSHTI
ncbi:hypothetical protein QFZ81_000103 [Paenibacillus sp. V4I9]|uniref:restriction endonuclease n=1 Tax=Paenibacillus sp. V4I9 TaxID=3042308 RepID=UPI002782F39D|nr:restriction endonuclease [Paenibacillus sp. V4I9]MDQ0885015.1 hypothetical protein [Paenibacillus sp. V4I9]